MMLCCNATAKTWWSSQRPAWTAFCLKLQSLSVLNPTKNLKSRNCSCKNLIPATNLIPTTILVPTTNAEIAKVRIKSQPKLNLRFVSLSVESKKPFWSVDNLPNLDWLKMYNWVWWALVSENSCVPRKLSLTKYWKGWARMCCVLLLSRSTTFETDKYTKIPAFRLGGV